MKRRDKKTSSSISLKLPELDFQSHNAKSEVENQNNSASVFVPMHYTKSYSYPLVVWLAGTNSRTRQISKIMPAISLRNYFGVSPIQLATSEPDLEGQIFESIAKVQRRYNICSNRVFIAGCGVGGCQAASIAMNHPEFFAGVVSLCGSFPRAPAILRDLRNSRKLPVFLAQSRGESFYPEEDLCEDLKLLHVGGFSVTARQYPGECQINNQMLHDLDVWMMEIINGFDMTKTDAKINERN